MVKSGLIFGAVMFVLALGVTLMEYEREEASIAPAASSIRSNKQQKKMNKDRRSLFIFDIAFIL